MWIILGLAALGFLIGNLVGLTASSVVTPLLGLLFAFVGGSVLGLFHKLDERDRILAGRGVLALSLLCLVGTWTGILTNEHRWLSPARANIPENVGSGGSVQTKAAPYLRSAQIDAINQIDRKKETGGLTAEQAYEQLYRLALACPETSRGTAQ